MKHLDDTGSASVIPSSDSTVGGVYGIDSRYMKKAALYARVSSDGQQKEGTIESQLAELKRQIAAADHVLVKEYIDDGITGTRLDRPALEELREDAKTDLFDRIYFLAADRIAREAAHQTIIISELLNRGKQITIGGKDYEQNPENKMTLQMLGIFSEFERAKIIERTTRTAPQAAHGRDEQQRTASMATHTSRRRKRHPPRSSSTKSRPQSCE